MVECIDDVQHEQIREALRQTGILRGVEITTLGDIPSANSGLGSSSTVTVGALRAYRGEIGPAARLAREACEIELDIPGKPIGVQDQHIAAYGGLRFFEFRPDGSVACARLELAPGLQRRLKEKLLLFYTRTTRQATSILGEQKRNIYSRRPVQREMKAMTYNARAELEAGRHDAFSSLLHESCLLKKQLASAISNSAVNDIYQAQGEAVFCCCIARVRIRNVSVRHFKAPGASIPVGARWN